MSLFSSTSYRNFVPFRNQNYKKLRNSLLKSRIQFYDNEFPPNEYSLFPSSRSKSKSIVWKRAQEINPNARLFVDGVSNRDIIQGDLGNCWLVAAFCTLAVHKDNWKKVIPDQKEQDWPGNTTGLFHFRFWRYGFWVDVVVDDYLPTKNGKLIFCHSPTRNEFWPALVEKAYAKLYGSYEALTGGELAEALEDFTGGVTESFELKEEGFKKDKNRKWQFFQFLSDNMKNNALICAAIPALTPEEVEQRTKQGLVKGHAYAITALLNIKSRGLLMARFRNPWGGIEWNGAYSDGSPEWKSISEYDKKMMGLVFEDDGEFWMMFEDVLKYFVTIAMCHTVNGGKYVERAFHSTWMVPDLAGGCINYKSSFLENPQYLLDVKNDGEDVLMNLIQKTAVKPGDERITIGFTILEVERNREERTRKMQKVVKSSIYKNGRSIFLQHGLFKGRYIIVVTTYEPNIEAPFLFRVYASRGSSVRELDSELRVIKRLPLMGAPSKAVTQVRVIKANKLTTPKDDIPLNAYCVVKCGRDKVVSKPLKNTSNPNWDILALFYRRNLINQPICVEVWNKSFPRDDFLGEQKFFAAEETSRQLVDLPLVVKTSDGGRMANGRIYLALNTSYNVEKM